MENKKGEQMMTSIDMLKIFFIVLTFGAVFTCCSSKQDLIKKEEELFYNGTGKWKILSYEYTSKNQGSEQTKKYTNCGTFEFNKDNEGKITLDADGLLITMYSYGLEEVGNEHYLVLYYKAFPLYANVDVQYNKLSLTPDEFTIVYDHSTFRATFVCKKVLQ